MQTKCDNCGKYFNTDDENYFLLHKIETDWDRRLCSPSCLIEYGWEEKQKQPKLSKSNVDLSNGWGKY